MPEPPKNSSEWGTNPITRITQYGFRRMELGGATHLRTAPAALAVLKCDHLYVREQDLHSYEIMV